MDAGFASAFFGLAGATIGGLTSFVTTWLTQHIQARDKRLDASRVKREELFGAFITEASRLYGDAMSQQRDDLGELVQLYAMVARMRLLATTPVVAAGEAVLEVIIAAYLAPNRTLQEMHRMKAEGQMDFLQSFGQACRVELGRF